MFLKTHGIPIILKSRDLQMEEAELVPFQKERRCAEIDQEQRKIQTQSRHIEAKIEKLQYHYNESYMLQQSWETCYTLQ